jgi:hypothetical protein
VINSFVLGLSNDIMQEKTKKWNYDFKNDTPLSSAANDPSTSTKSYEALDERNV